MSSTPVATCYKKYTQRLNLLFVFESRAIRRFEVVLRDFRPNISKSIYGAHTIAIKVYFVLSIVQSGWIQWPFQELFFNLSDLLHGKKIIYYIGG